MVWLFTIFPLTRYYSAIPYETHFICTQLNWNLFISEFLSFVHVILSYHNYLSNFYIEATVFIFNLSEFAVVAQSVRAFASHVEC